MPANIAKNIEFETEYSKKKATEKIADQKMIKNRFRQI